MGQIATPFVLSEADQTTLSQLVSKGKDGAARAVGAQTEPGSSLAVLASRPASRADQQLVGHQRGYGL